MPALLSGRVIWLCLRLSLFWDVTCCRLVVDNRLYIPEERGPQLLVAEASNLAWL